MPAEFSTSFMPTYSEYEAAIEKDTGEHSLLTISFVWKLFDKARRHRINAKLEPLATDAITEAASEFADLYHANVTIEPPHKRASFLFVIESVKHKIIPKAALEFANEVIRQRLIEVEKATVGRVGEVLFFVIDYEKPIEQARRWLDYVELTKESDLFMQFVALNRELTILCRTYDLLDGLILKQEAG